MACALRSVAGIESTAFDPAPSAARVIAWHKRLFGVPPTLVVKFDTDEIQRYGDAALDSAAAACVGTGSSPVFRPATGRGRVSSWDVRNALRQLTREYGLRVVVDSNDTGVYGAGLHGGTGGFELLEVSAHGLVPS